ncbi:hypothetical protein KY316_02845 [Candidatus Woesearchaeota archaeon]|nr:hypothetical protein [Candidatus Woesearchaeota archaeon]
MAKYTIFGVILALAVLAGCAEQAQITNFDECAAAGNPVMESYPRQCRANGQTFVEESCSTSEGEIYILTLNDAKAIAAASECGSNFKENAYCNSFTGTWWIDIDIEKQGCSPACVVDIASRTAEINWRCTGLIPE